MRIEIAVHKGDSTKEKGDLFEKLCSDLLAAQGFSVMEKIKVAGAELDLLCEHKVNGRQIYVECKAHRDKISAPVLRQLAGTVSVYEYTEGWIVSTSEFGKEAKGFIDVWKKKPKEKSSKLSFYSPQLVIESLQNASVICSKPISNAEEYVEDSRLLGEWTLLITPYGRFWAVYTLSGGAPTGTIIFEVNNGVQIRDRETLENISKLESTINQYDVMMACTKKQQASLLPDTQTMPNVVEVQIGDSWNDYRPARPQDFVGRADVQKEILSFLSDVKAGASATRIFSITGNSGLGKSSLIAKVRDRAKNIHYRRKFFVYAVDIRGAKSPSYITASFLRCLLLAQKSGFGNMTEISLTDPSTPLSSESVVSYLEAVESRGQVICLIFDQFEELYSKPELFSVFNAAKDLMMDVTSFKGHIALGFAWKTDSTTQQDHPAYHMWHELADYRRVYRLDVFNNGEIAKAITTFEKEAVKNKISLDIRHQIAHSSQGFPWLLKKLCINLYDNLKKGEDAGSVLPDLDVSRLFESDLNMLSPAEHSCLKLIAQKAPADWSEIIEISSVSVLNSLVYKRLVIKSGDRLNIYWDIFRDYLLTGKAPVLPFNYIPSSEFSTIIKVAKCLPTGSYITVSEIAKKSSLKERTTLNVGTDLIMFGLAERKGSMFCLHADITEATEINILDQLRLKLGKHAVKISIYERSAGKTIESGDVTLALKSCLPKSRFSDKTIAIYTRRLLKYLFLTGYVSVRGKSIKVQDLGGPALGEDRLIQKNRSGLLFNPAASPKSVYEAFQLVQEINSHAEINKHGFRNSVTVLSRLGLVRTSKGKVYVVESSVEKHGSLLAAIWTSAKNEPVLQACLTQIEQQPDVSGTRLGEIISSEHELNWTSASSTRNGNGFRQWALWILEGIEKSTIPPPPGRSKIMKISK